MSVVFFLPAFLSPFMPTRLSKFVLPIDIIFSYLYVKLPFRHLCCGTNVLRWLTAFIFAAQDYNWHNCSVNAPPGASCALKKANESFIFLAL
jgi:hypothetical protein